MVHKSKEAIKKRRATSELYVCLAALCPYYAFAVLSTQ